MFRGLGYVDTSVKYLFIDGGYLEKVIERYSSIFYPDGPSDFDYSKLGTGFSKVFYYHSPPTDERKQSEETNAAVADYLRRLNGFRFPGWHIFHGVRKFKRGEGNKQKQVDVQIAVDLLTHSFKRNMHSATLLAGDQDFVPVVEAIVKEGMQITVWDDLTTFSQELRDVADDRRVFDPWTFNELRRSASRLNDCRLPTKSFSPVLIAEDFEQYEVAESPNIEGRKFSLCRSDRANFRFAICPHERDVAGNYRVYSDSDPEFLKDIIHKLYMPLNWVPTNGG